MGCAVSRSPNEEVEVYNWIHGHGHQSCVTGGCSSGILQQWNIAFLTVLCFPQGLYRARQYVYKHFPKDASFSWAL